MSVKELFQKLEELPEEAEDLEVVILVDGMRCDLEDVMVQEDAVVLSAD